MLEGVRFFSSSTANGLASAVVEAFGFPAVWLVPRLDTVENKSLEKNTIFFLVDEEDVNLSPDCLTDISIVNTEL